MHHGSRARTCESREHLRQPWQFPAAVAELLHCDLHPVQHREPEVVERRLRQARPVSARHREGVLMKERDVLFRRHRAHDEERALARKRHLDARVRLREFRPVRREHTERAPVRRSADASKLRLTPRRKTYVEIRRRLRRAQRPTSNAQRPTSKASNASRSDSALGHWKLEVGRWALGVGAAGIFLHASLPFASERRVILVRLPEVPPPPQSMSWCLPLVEGNKTAKCARPIFLLP